MSSQSHSQRFPLWAYLNQPLFHPEVPIFFRPSRFWRHYSIEYLNRCLQQECQPNHNPSP